MEIEFEIKGRIPSKKNSRRIIMGRRRPFSVPSTAYKEWHRRSYLQIREVKKCEDIQSVVIMFYFPDNRKADLTNKAESIMDLLVDNKIITDDCWQQIPALTLVSRGIDKGDPRAEICIAYGK